MPAEKKSYRSHESSVELSSSNTSQPHMDENINAITKAIIAIKFTTPKLSTSLLEHVNCVSGLMKCHPFSFPVQYVACTQLLPLVSEFSTGTAQIDALELPSVHIAMFCCHIVKLIVQAMKTFISSPSSPVIKPLALQIMYT